MAGFRMDGQRGNLAGPLYPGDTIFTSDNPQAVALTTAQVFTGPQIMGGLIYRTGPTGAVTDNLPNPGDLLAALGGSLGPDILPGLGFRFRYMNGSTQTLTLLGPSSQGYGGGINNTTNSFAMATGTWVELFLQFTNTQYPLIALCSTVSGSPNVSFVLPQGQAGFPMGAVPGGINLQVGANLQTTGGTPIATATRIIGITQGPGGITGFTMSANAAATVAAATVNIGPFITINNIGSGTV